VPEPGVITSYLDELEAALRLPRRRRNRIRLEVQDHLLEAASHPLSEDADPFEAQERAIARFGPAPALAAEFHRQAASGAVGASLAGLAVGALAAAAAQALGSPLFWHWAGGLRTSGPWPFDVKGGVILAADLRAAADVVSLVALALAMALSLRRRRRGHGPDWTSALCGLVAAGALGVSALASLAEIAVGIGVGPTGLRLGTMVALLGATLMIVGAVTVRSAWRLWAVRDGWLPAEPLAHVSPEHRRRVRRGLVVAIPAFAVVSLAAAGAEFVRQGDLRAGANLPQLSVAHDATERLAGGTGPATVAAGPTVDLAKSLGVHITVFDSAGRVLASTAVLDGRTPVPPPGVLRAASHHTDIVTWQPRPSVRVAAVATAWSGPDRHGTIVVGRSLRLVEQRESRLLRRLVAGWLAGLALIAMATAIAARRERPPASHHRAGPAVLTA
jgi:hypothetical protein